MSSFNINISGLDEVKNNIQKITQQAQTKVQNALNTFGVNTVADAKTNSPIDEGFLRNSITFDEKVLEVEVVVAANYAAYLEFGTRKFAAAYVNSLPAEWQKFAEQFRGAGGGTFKELVARLTAWVHRKGLGSGFALGNKKSIGVAGTFSIKTGKRTGNQQTQESEDKQAAYVIALKILREGIRPQPFLFPAVEKNRIALLNELKEIFK